LTRWDEAFEQHPFRAHLDQLRDLLRDTQEEEDPGAEVELRRLRDVEGYVRTTCDRADPLLLPSALVDQADQHLQRVVALASAFRDSHDARQLVNANAEADQLLEVMARWPVIREAADVDDVRVRITRFRRTASQLLQQYRQEVEAARASLDGLRTDLESIRGAGQEHLDSLRRRVDEVAATIETQKGRLDEAIAQYQRQFSESEQARSQRFEEVTDRQRSELHQYLESLRTEGQDRLARVEAEAEAMVAGIREKEEEARTLAAKFGAFAISGGYGAYAEQQRKSADLWRRVAVGALCLLAIAAILFLATLPPGEVDWQRYVTKVLVSGPLVAIAGYAASQSHRHRMRERDARKLELELAALEPYLSLLPPEMRNEIKRDIALRVFGQPFREPDEGAQPGVGVSQLWDVLQQVVLKR
jgi:23S rRNA pseudoU1915 N3-methylase RlmH